LTIRNELQPTLSEVQTNSIVFINDPILVTGSDFLLGGNEGTTVAVIDGCFDQGSTGDCVDIAPIEVPIVPESQFERSRGTFAFAPTIAGIRPGQFRGRVFLRNRHGGGDSDNESDALPANYEMIAPDIFKTSPREASLGQYVIVEGGGFVGQVPGATTTLRVSGEFTRTGEQVGAPVPELILVPEFVAGDQVRYVLSEDDTLGQSVNLRQETGSFIGTMTPIITFGSDQVVGEASFLSFDVASVKQVVYLDFRISYVESLRKFGLRAVDSLIRERVVENIRRDFAGINLEVRTEPPEDYALFSTVEIAGPDLNGLGLLGYDSSTGKDNGNQRLYDYIGGVNALVQQDGFPGYGGVFIEFLLGFSRDPAGVAESLPGADERFDSIFDSFRPERGGSRVVANDLVGGVPKLSNADICPARDRQEQIACAVWVLGSLIATTVSHQLGHSLGLANPGGVEVHNPGDLDNRLMDASDKRPFVERAELDGFGPAVFCDAEYEYLRTILPSRQPADPRPRPSCL
ncbi:MAG: hypothetical protein AAGC55_03905, partial [Myxococcota bacterium]